MNKNDWSAWDGVHDDVEQQKRLASAEKPENTPLAVDMEGGSGRFSGSHGEYNTTLLSCSCADFVRRKKPCKHIYRLAIELGVIHAAVESDPAAIKRVKTGISLRDAVARVESAGNDAQLLIKSVMYETMFHKQAATGFVGCLNVLHEAEVAGCVILVDDPDAALLALGRTELIRRLEAAGVSGFKKNTKAVVLVQWCVSSGVEAAAIAPDVGVAVLDPALDKCSRKLYSYLLRKYDNDSYYDPKTGDFVEFPHGAEFVTTVGLSGSSSALAFPDDEVTRLLDEYGVNRCKEWRP